MKLKTITSLTCAMGALFIAGCKPSGSTSDSGSASGGPPAPAGDPDQVVVIEANDQMQYNINRFAVGAGETVQLTIKNVGTMPKFSMGHNVVILKKGVDDAAFVEAAMTHAGTEYIPPSAEGDIIAHTALTGGGEEDTITFVAPNSKGEYPFVCSFPGHYQIGMKGVMVVN